MPAVFFMRQNTAGSPLRPFRPRRPRWELRGNVGSRRAESSAPKRHKISFILLRSLIREYAAKGRRNKIDIIVIVQRRPG